MELKAGYKQTEVGVIPEDWCVSTIDANTTKVGSGITPTGGNRVYRESGRPFVRSQNVGWGNLLLEDVAYIDEETHSRFPETEIRFADALLNITGASIGRSAIADERLAGGNVNQHVCIIRALSPRLDPHFLNFLLLASIGQRQIDSFQAGGNRQGLNFAQVRSIQIPLPPAITEQSAIATSLRDVDALLSAQDMLIAKKRDIKQATMQGVLTGKRRLPGFSGEWEVRQFRSLASIAQGQVDPRVMPYRSMYLIGPEHVESGTGKLLSRRTALEQGAISGKYLFKKGDVVYGKVRPYLRKAFLANFDGLCSADMYPLRAVKDVAPGFLLATILGREFSEYSVSVSVRSGMPKINREEMAGFSTVVPKDLVEQTAIAQMLADMDADIVALETKRGKTALIRQGMMQELLTGKTRMV